MSNRGQRVAGEIVVERREMVVGVDAATRDRDDATVHGRPLELLDLSLRAQSICDLLRREVRLGNAEDAFLFAAALGQIVDDYLANTGSVATRTADYLLDCDRPGVKAIGQSIATLDRMGDFLRPSRPTRRRLTAARDEFLALAVDLARVSRGHSNAPDELQVRQRVDAITQLVASSGDRLASEVLRLPASFRSFDQTPHDIAKLTQDFSDRYPDRDRTIVVVGVRTSGSYLAPIAAAELIQLGYTAVSTMTARPGQALDRTERGKIKRVAQDDGLVVVVDDPPVSGRSVRKVVDTLRAAGVQTASVVLLLAAANDDGELPDALASIPSVVLGQARWEITWRLSVTEVGDTLKHMLPSNLELVTITSLEHPASRAVTGRSHARAVFQISLFDAAQQEQILGVVIAEGVGLGFFGRHSVAVGSRVAHVVPQLLGFENGVLYQLLLRVTPEVVPPEAVADYVGTRALALQTGHDTAASIRNRQTVPEVAAEMLGRAFGRADVPTRLWVTEPLVRRMLRVDAPSIVDGLISRELFIRGAGVNDSETVAWRKLGFADSNFTNRELLCNDAVYDLASPLARDPAVDRVLAAQSRAHWQDASGLKVEAERWLLYRLVHVWREHRANELCVSEHRRVSCVLQDYIAEVFFADLTSGRGSWCALDVDGVLETGVLGGTAPAADGALALRALLAHGYRVVIATGRSASEVLDRCDAWPISGGVAEYGTAMVEGSRITDLRTPEQVLVVNQARALLAKRAGVSIDDSYRHIVRAYRIDDAGARVSLDDSDIEALSDSAGLHGAVTIVPGESQTDIVPVGCDKGSGLTTLLNELDDATRGVSDPLALAVGDGVADIAMLKLARMPAVPRHGSQAARAHGDVTRGAYQAGFADAVTRLVGHRPGSCPVCRLEISDDGQAMLRVLSLRAAGGRRVVVRAARAIAAARKMQRASGDRAE